MLIQILMAVALAFVALSAFRWVAARPRPAWVMPAVVGVGVAALLWRLGVYGVLAGVAAGVAAWSFPRKRAAAPVDLDAAAARALLGVSASATDDDIRAAHRRLIADAHPDRGGLPDQASRLNAARDYLLARTRK